MGSVGCLREYHGKDCYLLRVTRVEDLVHYVSICLCVKAEVECFIACHGGKDQGDLFDWLIILSMVMEDSMDGIMAFVMKKMAIGGERR